MKIHDFPADRQSESRSFRDTESFKWPEDPFFHTLLNPLAVVGNGDELHAVISHARPYTHAKRFGGPVAERIGQQFMKEAGNQKTICVDDGQTV